MIGGGSQVLVYILCGLEQLGSNACLHIGVSVSCVGWWENLNAEQDLEAKEAMPKFTLKT